MVIAMDNQDNELYLKIGIIKALHTKELITATQMEQAIEQLYRNRREVSNVESNSILPG